MSFNRVQLNSLIFHNQVMLPRTSPGFGEVSLAVAELQGGDLGKAATFAEAAVAKDSHLAAGWLAKATADVFAANGADLRTERAMFCLERAFECAPDCRREMTEFFVTNLLAHYLSLVCDAALAHVAESRRLDAVGSVASGNARSLDTLGMVATITAFCAERESTRIVSGLTALGAYAESAVQWDRAFGLMKAAQNNASMAMLHIDPGYRLLWLAALMVKSEGLSDALVDPMVDRFLRALSGCLGTHLEGLRLKLEQPLWQYLSAGSLEGPNAANNALEAEYAKARGPVSDEERRFLKEIRRDIDTSKETGAGPADLRDKWQAEIKRFLRILDSPYPACQPLLECLDRILPGVRETEAYQLLASPRAALARVIGPSLVAPASPKTNPLNGCLHALGYVGSFVLLLVGALSLLALSDVWQQQPSNGLGLAALTLVLVLVCALAFPLMRWTHQRGSAIRAQEAAYQVQVKEHKRRAKEAEQRAKAPRERLARLVSDTFQRTRWGGVNDHGESTDRTIWSASTWLGERPEERVKARLFGGAEAPALEDAFKMGPVSTSDAGASSQA